LTVAPDGRAVVGGPATVKPLHNNGKSPPVTRGQQFSGGYAAGGCAGGNGGKVNETDELDERTEPLGQMIVNGFAISATPEDRKPLLPSQLSARVWIREIRPPAISSGPDDNLDDFKIA
jgi:hypothetical protein